MPRPATADPRAELINWDVIDLSQLPPIEEWTDDEWDDAALGTYVHWCIQEREAGRGGPLITFEELLDRLGIRPEQLDLPLSDTD